MNLKQNIIICSSREIYTAILSYSNTLEGGREYICGYGDHLL